jgi:rubrerythrin
MLSGPQPYQFYRGCCMVGAIRKWEILSHPIVTIQCFGWAVFFRAVSAGPNQTFLSLLTKAGLFEQLVKPVPVFIGRCIDLERRAMKVYDSLSRRYSRSVLVSEFFDHLAHQEQDHAELLELCRAAAGRGRWQEGGLDRRRENLPETERQLKEAEAILDQHHSIADALKLVIDVESSHINQLFTGVVEATDPRLARKLQAFRSAVKDHLQYICERIPVLDPNFSEACRALWAEVSNDRLVNLN